MYLLREVVLHVDAVLALLQLAQRVGALLFTEPSCVLEKARGTSTNIADEVLDRVAPLQVQAVLVV